MTDNSEKDKSEDIIELSDIAVGTSREDEEIIELTEDLVDEARSAISGATLETGEESSQLELTQEPETSRRSEDQDTEQDIARELENYFPIEEEAIDFIELDDPLEEPAEPPRFSITDQQVEAAVERLVERKYSQRIESLIDEMIRRKVSEDIENLKDMILKRGNGR